MRSAIVASLCGGAGARLRRYLRNSLASKRLGWRVAFVHSRTIATASSHISSRSARGRVSASSTARRTATNCTSIWRGVVTAFCIVGPPATRQCAPNLGARTSTNAYTLGGRQKNCSKTLDFICKLHVIYREPVFDMQHKGVKSLISLRLRAVNVSTQIDIRLSH